MKFLLLALFINIFLCFGASKKHSGGNNSLAMLIATNQKFEADCQKYLEEIEQGVVQTNSNQKKRSIADNIKNMFLLLDATFKTKADIFAIRAPIFKDYDNKYDKYRDYILKQSRLVPSFLKSNPKSKVSLLNSYLNIASTYNRAIILLEKNGHLEYIRKNYHKILAEQSCPLPSFDANQEGAQEKAEKRKAKCLQNVNRVQQTPLNESLNEFGLYNEKLTIPFAGEVLVYLKYRDGVIDKFDLNQDIKFVVEGVDKSQKAQIQKYLNTRKDVVYLKPSSKDGYTKYFNAVKSKVRNISMFNKKRSH